MSSLIKPLRPASDGHFRKIEVKLERVDLRVETRTGYFAVPETGEGPLVPGDFGALQALDAKTRPHRLRLLILGLPLPHGKRKIAVRDRVRRSHREAHRDAGQQ